MTLIFPYIGGGSIEGGGGGTAADIHGSALIGVDTSGNEVWISSRSYVHEQGIASETWEIQHNLNKYPSVVLVDSAGTVFNSAIIYNDMNKCTVSMNGATTGKAYLN